MPLREFSRDQGWLFPPCLDEMVAEDHGPRLVAAFVDSIGREGWEELGVSREGEARGRRPTIPGCSSGSGSTAS